MKTRASSRVTRSNAEKPVESLQPVTSTGKTATNRVEHDREDNLYDHDKPQNVDQSEGALNDGNHILQASKQSFSDAGTLSEQSSSDDEYKASRRPSRRKTTKAATVPSTAEYLALEPTASTGPSSGLGDGAYARAYVGSFDRNARGNNLVEGWYGPERGTIEAIQRLLDRLIRWTVLPPKREVSIAPWDFTQLHRKAKSSRSGTSSTICNPSEPRTCTVRLSHADARPYWPSRSPLPVLIGPYDSQVGLDLEPGTGHALNQEGLPHENDCATDKPPAAGWILDTGGLVVGMDWAPRQDTHIQRDQILALAVIPHADDELSVDNKGADSLYDQRFGTVQLWTFKSEKGNEDFYIPTEGSPVLRKTLCLDEGRARRVKWSPCGNNLAVLLGDGGVCVLEATCAADCSNVYDKVTQTEALLKLSGEASTKATALTWVALNRIAVGYSDGSICLWSVHPAVLLSRHPVHHNDIVSMASGYPSKPYLVASSPIGGATRFVDLRSPSYETTEVATPVVNVQANLIAWNDHLLGFFSALPSSNPLNTTISFMHHAQFPVVRRAFLGDSPPTCISVGRTHPFLLIGASDGSLWATNPLVEVFASKHTISKRLRIFQHEHRPKELYISSSTASKRGASRVLQGFPIENARTMATDVKQVMTKKSELGMRDELGDENEDGMLADVWRGIVHEPGTRIAMVEWNPNDGHGCWAAAAMASGLVKVMDLGLEALNLKK